MIIFDRLFAAYYFGLLKFRRINKTRIEYFQAMYFVLCSQILLITTMIFIRYKYFLSNRNRKNKIIDNYRELPVLKKTIWQIVSASLILIPLFVIILF